MLNVNEKKKFFKNEKKDTMYQQDKCCIYIFHL